MKTLKILGIIFLIIVSAAGGVAFRLMEVLNDPNPLPLPKPQTEKIQAEIKTASGDTELAVAEIPEKNDIVNVRSSVNVLVVGDFRR